MNKQTLVLGVVLFSLGFIGVLSLLLMEIPLPEETEKLLLSQFSATEIKWLLLVNPTIMLIISVLVGLFLHKKVMIGAPVIDGIIQGERNFQLPDIFKSGIAGGVISGVLIVATGTVFAPIIPREFIELGENINTSVASRFLYGGITEEILMRFGLMTFLVWLLFKIFRSLSAGIYWTAIFVSAVLFALGHFPIVFQSIDNPPAVLLAYVIIGNSIGGIVFGWLYWKKGLEVAMIAHIFTHVIMLAGEQVFS